MTYRLKLKKFEEYYTKVWHKLSRDKDLSLRAKGLHAFMCGFPDEWEFTTRKIADGLKEGRNVIMATLNELIEHGYIEREKLRDKDQHVYYLYYIYPIKKTEFEKIHKQHD
jgi:predicted transcriptional regulator